MADSRPSGNIRSALRVYLHTFANGLCVICGEMTDLNASSKSPNAANIGHIKGAEIGGKYIGGNVANQCRDCNQAAQSNGIADLTPFIPFFVYAEGIPASIPGSSALIASKVIIVDDARAIARKNAGLPF